MRFESTRKEGSVDLDTALLSGLAPDGGLYVPTSLPQYPLSAFEGADDLLDIAEVYLQPFFEGSRLATSLPEIVAETFHFPIPLLSLANETGCPVSVLELFHGPTAAFKDVGAGFLAACLTRLDDAAADRPLTILVATSGDTGGAVASAFHRRDGVRVVVLFPKGKVSPRQQHQLTCWGDNIVAAAVEGTFDDCQRMVKAAFVDPVLRREYRFSSANSINIGRLIPQSVYYAAASLSHFRQTGKALSFIVPTGNLGNGLAAVLARACGLPIDDITFVSNANRTVPDYFASGEYQPRDSIETLASAMDVGAPSNLERLRHLFGERDALLQRSLSAETVNDDAIRAQIARDAERFEFAWCPHSATAMHVWDHLDANHKAKPQAVVATAHPAKFETIVEPIIGRSVEIPGSLQRLLALPSEFATIPPELDALASVLQG
ncbi:MAG: threonine synthase [Pseudomonadota bacterium]